MNDGPAERRGHGRATAVGALLAIGTLLWICFGLGLWVQRQALDSEEWANTSERLLENEPVRTALGLYLVDQIYTSADVEQRIGDALPKRLNGLAAPAAAGLKEVARRNAPRLLGNAVALRAWRDANEQAHAQLLRLVKSDVADQGVALNLKTLLQQVADGTGLPPGAADRLPPEVARLEIVKPDQLQTAQTALDVFEKAVWVLLGLALASFAGAIWLSRDRRRTVMALGGCLIFAGVAVLAARQLAGKAVVDALAFAPNAKEAAPEIWGIATSLLVDAAEGSMLFGAFVVTGGWLVGPGRRATALRRISAPSLRDHPALVRAALGGAILLLVLWGPVPWTERFVPLLLFTVAAFVWLERVRRRTLDEFPDVPPGEWSRRARERLASVRRGGTPAIDRSASLERLADLRERGVLDEAEFQSEKAALLASG